MVRSFEGSDILFAVPAAGRGTRLGKLTEHQAKPSIPVGFDPVSGEVQRMIDIPLGAIQQLGGMALVSTHYAARSLDFVSAYGYTKMVDSDGSMTPIDCVAQNRRLVEVSQASLVGIVPADARATVGVLAGLRDFIEGRCIGAAILATEHVKGHNVRPVDGHGVVLSGDVEPDRYLADLGVHMFDKAWLLGRIDACGVDANIDVWEDIYQIDNPVTNIGLFVPPDDRGWVDMGTPSRLQDTIYELNARQIDANGNLLFPSAQLLANSTRTIGLPSSTGLSSFRNVIIPENMTADTAADVLEI